MLLRALPLGVIQSKCPRCKLVQTFVFDPRPMKHHPSVWKKAPAEGSKRSRSLG
ncbi:MAG: hypothetical protein IH941_05620 [Acidobacteria bacterium]|nr:hypothetical protein [Acidobacteriota bacterium]